MIPSRNCSVDIASGGFGDRRPQLIGDRLFVSVLQGQTNHEIMTTKGINDWVSKCTTNFADESNVSSSASKPRTRRCSSGVVAESKPTEATNQRIRLWWNMKSTTEDTIHKTLSNFAPVKEVRLVRDRVTNESRGFAFVDFYTIEQAEHCIKSAVDVRVDGALVTLNFSKGDRRIRHVSNEFTSSSPQPPQQPPPPQQQQSELDAATIEAYRKRKEEKMYSKFPLPFESAGTDYTFDPSTEQYYEPVHGFTLIPRRNTTTALWRECTTCMIVCPRRSHLHLLQHLRSGKLCSIRALNSIITTIQ